MLPCEAMPNVGREAKQPDARDRRAPAALRGLGNMTRVTASSESSRFTVLVAHSTTSSTAAGHHHAGSSVRLPGGQYACVVSHVADYDAVRRHTSNHYHVGEAQMGLLRRRRCKQLRDARTHRADSHSSGVA